MRLVLVPLVLGLGCGEVMAPPPDAQSAFTLGGTVSGFAGRDLVLQLAGGEELTITDNGAFAFPTRLETGTSYAVTIKSQPICPVRRCAITNGSGTIDGADASIEVTCETPKQRLASGNWGERSVRITDNVLGLGTTATATPRILKGPNTQITTSDVDSLAYDASRDIVYMASGSASGTYGYGVLVYRNASTLSGDVNYDTRIKVANETELLGVEIDEAADRLYVSGRQGVYVMDLASTLSGQVIPVAKLVVEDPTTSNAGTITLDTLNDRLYIAGEYTSRVHVFDNARSITSAKPASRTVSWPSYATAQAFEGPPAVAIDACRDRLYLGSNDTSPAGFNMFVFDNASKLDGAIDPETASQAQLRTAGMQSISATIDSEGNLYYWEDGATQVLIHESPETLAGAVSVMADRTISGVVERGYGLAVVPYF